MKLTAEAVAEGLLRHEVPVLSRAITLAESQRPADIALVQKVLRQVHNRTGGSYRLGITGSPGVGKSTFIEAFGQRVLARGGRLAVLAVDPSSARTGGSILGDKTRMELLARHPQAYIRPSPSGGGLGGVNRATRESILLCEAAGFDWVIVETVGVGQSETTVRGMVDCFLLLLLAGAGDELQGIKRGIMEMADVLVVTKADGGNHAAAQQAAAAYRNALHLFPPPESNWTVPVQVCSALEGTGLDALLDTLLAYRTHTQANGYWQHQRRAQQLQWFQAAADAAMRAAFLAQPGRQALFDRLRAAVASGEVNPTDAIAQLVAAGAHSGHEGSAFPSVFDAAPDPIC